MGDFTLPLTGTDPKRASIEDLVNGVNAVKAEAAANLDTSAAVARGTLAADVDLNTVRKAGTHYGSATSNYVNVPEGVSGKAFYLTVETPGIGGTTLSRWTFQRLATTVAPGVIYVRHVDADNPGGVYPWRQAGLDDYRGSFVAASIDALLPAGSYVLSGGFTGGPAAYTQTSGLLINRAVGSFTLQRLVNTADAALAFERIVRPAAVPITYGDWRSVSGSGGGLSGQVVVCLGDSITENGDYVTRLAVRSGATAINGGFGGTRLTEMVGTNLAGMCGVDVADDIATGDWGAVMAGAELRNTQAGDDNRAIVTRLSQLDWSQVNRIVAFWGTNDYSNGVPLGMANDDNRTTIRGAVAYVTRRILTAHPQIRMLWVAPMFRARISVGDGLDSDSSPNSVGVFLAAYGDAIMETAARFHQPVLDLYRSSGIGPLNYAHYLRDQTIDGLHPFPGTGTERIAECVSGALGSF